MEVIHLVFSGEGLRVSSVFRTPTGQLRAQCEDQLLKDLLLCVSSSQGERSVPKEETAPKGSVPLWHSQTLLTGSSLWYGVNPSFPHSLSSVAFF